MNTDEIVQFVGRSSEIAHIRAAISGRDANAPLVLCVSGPAGIGKTALVEHVFAGPENASGDVYWARCWNETATPALWPWRRLLESIALNHDLDFSVVELVESGDRNRFAQFDTISRVLRERSAESPITLVLDDVHWADAASLELLRFVARDRGKNALTIVVTYREPEMEVGHHTDRIVEVEREATLVRLGGLPVGDIGTLLGVPAVGTEVVVDELHQRTAGNPYFISELVRLHRHGDDLDIGAVSATPVTTGVKGVIESHLRLIDPPTREMLEVAAVQGLVFDPAVVAAAVQLDDLELLEMLEAARRARLIERCDADWRFDHALIGETLLGALAPHQVALHHLATADGIEKLDPFGLADNIEPIANHLAAAGSMTPADRLLESSLAASDHAADRLAWEDQSHHLSTAIGALNSIGNPDPSVLVDLMLRRCDLEKLLGNHEGAVGLAEEAAVVSRTSSDPLLLAQVALAYPPNSEFIEIDEIHDPTQAELRAEALSMLDPQEQVLRAKLQAALALSLYWSTQASNRAESHRNSASTRDLLTRESLETARRLSDDSALAAALSARIHANWGPAAKEERPSLADELALVGERLGEPHTALVGRVWIISDLLERAELATADRAIEAFSHEASRTHDRLHMWTALRWRANRALMTGDFDNVEVLSTQALSLATEIMPADVAFQFFTTAVGPLHYLQGRLAESFEYAQERAEQSPNVPAWRVGLATIASEMGLHGIARRELRVFSADDFEMLPRDLNFIGSMMMAALVAHTLGDVEAAEAIEHHLSPSSGRLAIHGTGYASYGAVDLALAQCAEVAGRPDDAIDLYHSAIELCETTGNPYADVSRLYLGRCVATRNLAYAVIVLSVARDGLVRWGLDEMARRAELALEEVKADAICSLTLADGLWWLGRGQRDPILLTALKGFAPLQQLLTYPQRSRSALELAALMDGHPGEWVTAEPALERIDGRARSSYERRLAELNGLLDSADLAGDEVASARFARERDAITEELVAATGFAGRTVGDPTALDRARVNVTKHLRRAISAIEQADSMIGQHLSDAIRTGAHCTYEPARDAPFEWVDHSPAGLYE